VPRRWAVTGAAGFIGRAVVRRLLARGDEVVTIDRLAVDEPGVTHVPGDITGDGPWQDALADVEVVVHTAAIVTEAGAREAFEAVNVAGARRVAVAAGRAGAQLIHLSSIVVYGADFPVGSLRDEDAPLRPTGAPYTDTKIAAEQAVLAVAAQHGSHVTIVRPGDVYGAASHPWVLRPLDLLERGLFTLVDGGRWPLSPVHVDDVVAGILAAGDTEVSRGRIYNLAGAPVPAREFFGHHAAHLDVRLRSLPRPAALTVMRAMVGAARLAGRTAPLAPEAIEYVTHPGGYATDRAGRELGWRPAVPLAEGLPAAIADARVQAGAPPTRGGPVATRPPVRGARG
jgi:2-alkyl-3-oxoalkanoate reductase